MFRGGLLNVRTAKMMVGEVEVKERPRPSPDYLMQLLNEKKLMTSLPNLCGIFTHLERLLDEGKLRRMHAGDGGEHGHGAVRRRLGFAGVSVPQNRERGSPAFSASKLIPENKHFS